MIAVKDIDFSYSSESPVFKQFNLQINKGALFGLLAPNGAGKTTLIKLITGINMPDKGQVLIDGDNFTTERNAILNKIAVVPQEYAFYSQFTAYENLHFFSRLYRHTDPENKIKQALKLTRLEDHQHRLAKTFSGGLKRRLNFAIGLLNNPDLLILDEPTVGIDAQSRQSILEAIADINKQGTTILFTSHYIDEIEEICDTVAIMDQGKILSMGSMEQLLGSTTTITIRLKDELHSDRLAAPLAEFIKLENLIIDKHQICGNLSDSGKLSSLISMINEHGYNIKLAQYGQQTLESLFFELVKTSH